MHDKTITILLLVSCMSTGNHLLYFARFCAGSTPKTQNSQQKHTTKNFAKFPNHFSQLTMSQANASLTFLIYASAKFSLCCNYSVFLVANTLLVERESYNRPRSIYQYSNMAPRLSGQTSIFGVVFFVFESLLGIDRQKRLKKFTILTRKPRSHVRILIYRTWPIGPIYDEKFVVNE